MMSGVRNDLVDLVRHLLVLFQKVRVVVVWVAAVHAVQLRLLRREVACGSRDDEPLSVLLFEECDGRVEHHQGKQFILRPTVVHVALLALVDGALAQRRLAVRAQLHQVLHLLLVLKELVLTCSLVDVRQVGGQIRVLNLSDVGPIFGGNVVLNADVVLACSLVRAQEVAEATARGPHQSLVVHHLDRRELRRIQLRRDVRRRLLFRLRFLDGLVDD